MGSDSGEDGDTKCDATRSGCRCGNLAGRRRLANSSDFRERRKSTVKREYRPDVGSPHACFSSAPSVREQMPDQNPKSQIQNPKGNFVDRAVRTVYGSEKVGMKRMKRCREPNRVAGVEAPNAVPLSQFSSDRAARFLTRRSEFPRAKLTRLGSDAL